MAHFPLQMVDHLGRSITLEYPPQRIVSLCPSQTQTLLDFGLGSRVVGRTRFCIHPQPEILNVQQVGGTKEIKWDRLHDLYPDLVICEKEENTQEMVEELEGHYPVFVTDVRDVPSCLQMVKDLGIITDMSDSADKVLAELLSSFQNIQPLKRPLSCLYFIWKDPWMVVGADNFIDSMLQKCGFVNVAAPGKERYPVYNNQDLSRINPEVVFLSSEPFPFKDGHLEEMAQFFPNATIKIVDGEAFSWYGSHLVGVEKYLNMLLQDL